MKKNNKALGLFMGLTIKFIDLKHIAQPSFWMIVGDYPHETTPSRGMITSFNSEDGAWSAFEDQSRYHTSYDWIMGVIEKIESQGYSVETTHIGNDYGVKIFSKDMKMLKYTAMSTTSRLEALYLGALTYIEGEARERVEKVKKQEEQKRRDDDEAERQRRRKQDDEMMLAIIASCSIAGSI